MKSVALLRFSALTCVAAGLAIAAAPLISLSLSLPSHQLQLAWTLTQVLIQL